MSNTQKNSQARMDIDVKIYRPSATGPVLADASVSLNGCFAIRDIQVRKGKTAPLSPCLPARGKTGIEISASPARRSSSRPLTGPSWARTGWNWSANRSRNRQNLPWAA